ncbi:hypothetical protein [Sphingomonas kyeonggiensis]|uniref:Uncharacterized protein n=1 Tax=Sphingomonas kyeonggiensis TaxID=1268553 RepID=A0A7W6NU58_9SPHN|nr:hypothetical protein [Sphingomonas kyeonggiensis]MBB4096664.1 hypothetical protein [Sphingomonas kyeonggiensis]
MDIESRLKATGLRQPVTVLWFSVPRASVSAVFFAICAAIGFYMAWSFHLHPDQLLSGRSAWLGVGHGMAGFLLGLVLGALALGYAVRALFILATWRPAIAMTASGIEISRAVSRHALLRYDQIVRVQTERREARHRFAFRVHRKPTSFYLVVHHNAVPDAKPVRIWSRDLRGGHRGAHRFAGTLRRTLVLHREGRV